MTIFQETSAKNYVAEYLGMVPYDLALERQQSLAQARAQGTIPDTVLLLQHPHVYTVGRFRGKEDLKTLPEGVDFVHTSRGGSITYHGPGQLVGYPIINLKERGLGVRDYIWKLEEVIIRLLHDFGIEVRRNQNYPGGVWANEKKLCSIGIHASHHIASHGFALNVNTDLSYFDFINPCGLRGTVMTSMSELLGYEVQVEDVVDTWLRWFSEVFGLSRRI
jgi:lipoate-protein ligase B